MNTPTFIHIVQQGEAIHCLTPIQFQQQVQQRVLYDNRLQQRVLDGVLYLAILKKNNASDDDIYEQIRYIQKLQFQQRIRDFERTANFQFKIKMKKFYMAYTDLASLLRYYTTSNNQFHWTHWYHKWELFRNVVYIKINSDVYWLIRDMIQENINKAYSSKSRKKGFLNRNLEKVFGIAPVVNIQVDLYNARVRVTTRSSATDLSREEFFDKHPDFLRHLNLSYYRANYNFLQTKLAV